MATGGKSLDDDDSWNDCSIDEFQKLETDDKLVELFKVLCSLNTRVKNIENHFIEDTVPKRIIKPEQKPAKADVALKVEDGKEEVQNEPKHKMLSIGALNVKSLQNRFRYNEFSNLIAGCDILCCTETFLQVNGKTNIVEIEGYDFYSQARRQIVDRASGGIGFYVEKSLLSNHVTHLVNKSDYVMWLYISKRFTNLGHGLVIGIVYIPPATSRYYGENHMQRLTYEISKICKIYQYVLLTGDMNAHTAGLIEIEMSKLTSQDKTTLFGTPPRDESDLNRSNQDTETNNTGHRLIEICKQNNLFILNGRFGQDKTLGKYTYKDKSVLDYSIATFRCLECLKDFEIIETRQFDGHALLKTKFEFKGDRNTGD